MTRKDAIIALKESLINYDEQRFIEILESFRATTAIVIYLISTYDIDERLRDKSIAWLIKRVGGKTASKLLDIFIKSIIKEEQLKNDC